MIALPIPGRALLDIRMMSTSYIQMYVKYSFPSDETRFGNSMVRVAQFLVAPNFDYAITTTLTFTGTVRELKVLQSIF